MNYDPGGPSHDQERTLMDWAGGFSCSTEGPFPCMRDFRWSRDWALGTLSYPTEGSTIRSSVSLRQWVPLGQETTFVINGGPFCVTLMAHIGPYRVQQSPCDPGIHSRSQAGFLRTKRGPLESRLQRRAPFIWAQFTHEIEGPFVSWEPNDPDGPSWVQRTVHITQGPSPD